MMLRGRVERVREREEAAEEEERFQMQYLSPKSNSLLQKAATD